MSEDAKKQLDVDLVNAEDWPEQSFPIEDQRGKTSVRMVIKQSVLNEIHQHGLSRTDVEVCGVMIGNGYRDEQGPFVYVEAIIQGQHSDSQVAQVTFTGETWNHIHNRLDQDFPEMRILGWYHTHPGFGIFLSGMDLFIHENYFSAPEQIAFVFDPISGDEGLFVWRSGKATRGGFLVEKDAEEDPVVGQSPPAEETPVTAAAGAAPKVSDDVLDRIERIEQRQKIGALFIVVVATLAIGIPLAGWLFLIEPKLPKTTEPPAQKKTMPARPTAPGAKKPADTKPETNQKDSISPSQPK